MTKTPSPAKRGGRAPLVRDSSDTLRPFLRGMVTHDLVQRGMSFDDAYAAARALRDRLADRGEITTNELEDLIHEQLVEMFGDEQLAALKRTGAPAPEPLVSYPGQRPLPFSRGFLAQSLLAIGLDLDRAYRLVVEVQNELRAADVTSLDSRELARWVGDLLERREGSETAGRYRLLRQIRRLPRPLVIYLGGASGTGKSTLSLELAPLLRISRINATDTIRQVMRMVFSSAILPSLHRSSFEVPAAPSFGADGQRSDVVAAFEEQAIRVCVGVRAVVERSIAENLSTLVEGVHLVPGLLPWGDLDGAAFQVMVMLTTRDAEVHRARFLARRPLVQRRAERYLRSFDAISELQDHLLQLADEHDVPLLETSDPDRILPRSVRLVAGMLERRLPWLTAAAGSDVASPVPSLLLLIDGLSDQPVRALGGRTPLQAASTPTLDRLAREGRTGLADPVEPDVVPDTASGNLAALGQPPAAMRRGPIEALGAGMELRQDDVALRGNFATLDAEGRVEDRRAGRIRDDAKELAAAVDGMVFEDKRLGRVEVLVRPGTEHRLAVVLRGEGLSSAIVGSDPGEAAPLGPPLQPRPVDPEDEAGLRTAKVLGRFGREAQRILAKHAVNRRRRKEGLPPANAILTRGAGRVHRLQPLLLGPGGLPLRMTCVSGDRTVLGLATVLGAETVCEEGMTANLDSDLGAKFGAAGEALAERDLVVLHLKGADIAAHDKRPDLKVEYLERVDRELAKFLDAHDGEFRIAVASDHTTLSQTGLHGVDPVPVLIWGPGIEPDEVETYDEASVADGALGRFPLQILLERLFALS